MARQKANTATQLTATVTSYTSTTSGWSSFTTNETKYVKIGKLVHVFYNLNGTSNTTSVTFTLPSVPDYTVMSNWEGAAGLVVNNGAVGSGGRVFTAATGTNQTVTVYYNGSGTWTASGTKQVRGVFTYIEA